MIWVEKRDGRTGLVLDIQPMRILTVDEFREILSRLYRKIERATETDNEILKCFEDDTTIKFIFKIYER